MAQAKKREEVLAEETTAAEVQEVVADETVTAELPDDTSVATTDTDATEDGDETEEKTAKAGKRSAKALREAEEEAQRLAAKDERAEEDDEPKAPRRQLPNPLHQHGKKYRDALAKVDRTKLYAFEEALELARETATTKFDSSVELHINLGVDPRQADQMVRSTVVLPHGTGKTLRVAVFADGAAAEAAKAAGADRVGTTELIADIEAGKLDFDLLVATPDKMAQLGRVARVLGPRGLMPNPKSGTVTPDAAKAVTDAKGGKVEFRIDKTAIVHQAIGKVSFTPEQIRENATALLSAILKVKPAAAKGTYVKGIAVTTSMGPGIKLDSSATIAAISGKK